MPIYVVVINFTKLVQVLLAYLSYFFYITSHWTQLRCSVNCFIQGILSRQQFDINQEILNIITPYCDPTAYISSLPFTLIILQILVNVNFDLDQTLTIPKPQDIINANSWSKHFSYVYDLISLLAITLGATVQQKVVDQEMNEKKANIHAIE